MAKYREGNEKNLFDFVEIQVAGENHSAHGGNKLFSCSEKGKLKYVSYAHFGNKLEILSIVIL